MLEGSDEGWAGLQGDGVGAGCDWGWEEGRPGCGGTSWVWRAGVGKGRSGGHRVGADTGRAKIVKAGSFPNNQQQTGQMHGVVRSYDAE